MTADSSQFAARRLARLSLILLIAALLLGGSGAVAPLHNLIIEWIAIALLALLSWPAMRHPRPPAERAGVILLLLIAAVPLIQLVPLPFAVWTDLPGRELAVQIDGSLDGSPRWRALSLNPEATWLAALYLLAPLAVFLTVLRLDATSRRHLVAAVAGCALASMLLGLLQAANGDAFHLYDSTHNRFATGLFINRNHQASFLLVAMPLTSALIAQRQSLSPPMRFTLTLSLIVAFSAGVIATMSRMGLLLLPVAIIGTLSYLPISRLLRRRRLLLAGLAIFTLAAISIGLSAGTQRTLARFESLTDSRFGYWPDVLFAIRQYLPWGSGVGTFDTVYRPIEDLNLVEPSYINHAHNEYLQIALEAGVPGLLLLVFFLILFIGLSLRSLGPLEAPYRRAASTGILILLLHSSVDYPLRTVALVTLFGLLCALLYPVGKGRGPARSAMSAL